MVRVVRGLVKSQGSKIVDELKHSIKTEGAGGKYVRVLEVFGFWTRYGYFEVPVGFVYDGSSEPWVAVFLLRLGRHDPRILAPSGAHDFFYRSKILTQEQADTVYFDMMLENEIRAYKAKTHYWFLRRVGHKAWDDQPDEFRLDPR